MSASPSVRDMSAEELIEIVGQACVEAARKAVEDATAELEAAAKSTAPDAALKSEVDSLRAQVAELEAKLDELDTAPKSLHDDPDGAGLKNDEDEFPRDALGRRIRKVTA